MPIILPATTPPRPPSATVYPIVRFVDQPTLDATVRYDLQSKPAKVLEDGFSIGAPELTGDVDGANPQWSYRQIKLIQMIDAKPATAHALLVTLARELLRSRNWLLFQFSANSRPLWFRTFLTQPEEIDFSYVYSDETRSGAWRVSVTLEADPWAYGEEVTIPAATINNNPTSTLNPCLFLLPDIAGDAPAPLRIRARAAIAANREATTAVLSVLGSDLASPNQLLAVPYSTGVDTATVPTGTADFVDDNYHRVSFLTTPGMATRVRYSGPVVRHGSYKVYVRIRASAGSNVFQLQVSTIADSPAVMADRSITVTTDFQYVSIGTIDWPPGARVDDEFLPDRSLVNIALRAARLSGTGDLLVDCLVLLPVGMDDGDADTMTVTYPTSVAAADAAYIDTRTRSVRLVTPGLVPVQVDVPAAVIGQFPFVTPGVQNVLRYFQSVRTDVGAGGDVESTTATLTLSYNPQWLFLGDQP